MSVCCQVKRKKKKNKQKKKVRESSEIEKKNVTVLTFAFVFFFSNGRTHMYTHCCRIPSKQPTSRAVYTRVGAFV